MERKSSYYWPLIILGFLFIAAVTFCFLHCYLELCVSQIMNDKSEAGSIARKNLFRALLYIPGSLLVTAAIFYWAARQLGWGGSAHYSDSNLKAELDDCRQQYNDLLVQSSGGKIDHEFSNKSSRDVDTNMGASAYSDSEFQGTSSSNMASEMQDEAASEDMSDLDQQLAAKKEELRARSDDASSASATGAAGATASGTSDASKGGSAKEDTSSAATFDDSAAKAVFGKKIKVDDLKLVEGIGPKIESILNKYNINTWKDLAQESPEKISEYLLTEGGASYKIHDPSTWPKQAKLAADGLFEDLKKLQDNLKGGREVS